MPYFVDSYFQGALHVVEADKLAAVTPYGAVAIAPQTTSFTVSILPFVPALTEVDVNEEWLLKNAWVSYKLVKTPQKPNGMYKLNPLTPDMSVGDTFVFYDTKPADPA